MFNFKYFIGGAGLILATSALAGGPEVPPAAPAPVSNSGFYINANGGVNFLTNSAPFNTTGFNVGGALGYRFSNNIRLEVASNYWRHNLRNNFNVNFPGFLNVATSALQMVTVMGNVYYDFNFGNSFVPYVGAGLGWAGQWFNTTITFPGLQSINAKLNTSQIAFQGILGLDYKINDNVRLGLSYHALGFGGQGGRSFGNPAGNGSSLNFSFENQINLGLSYFF